MECAVPPPIPKNLRIPEEFVEWERFIPFLTSFTVQVRAPFFPRFTFQCHKCVRQKKCICVCVCRIWVCILVCLCEYARVCAGVCVCIFACVCSCLELSHDPQSVLKTFACIS